MRVVVGVLVAMVRDLSTQAAFLFSAVVLIGGFLGRPPAVTALSVVVALSGAAVCVLAWRRRWPTVVRIVLALAVVAMDFGMLVLMA